MLLIIDDLSRFLIERFWICSDVVSSESLLTQEKRSTRLFLISTICQADSSAIQLRVFSMTVAELERFVEPKEFIESEEFVESKEFRNSEKSVWLYLDISEYLNDLFL